MKKVLTTILLLLIFSGCASQKVVIQKELICYDFIENKISDEVQIRIHKDDKMLFESRNQELRSALAFYEKQNLRYKQECKKWKLAITE